VSGTLAYADAPLAEAELSYTVSPDAESCPDETALRQEVSLRLGYDPFRAGVPHHVGVAITKTSRGFAARVTSATGDAPVATRALESEAGSCDELARSVVLTVSLAVDPRSFGGPRVASPHPPSAPAPPAPPPPSPPPTEPAPAEARPPVPPLREARPRWNVDFMAGARVGFGVVPGVSVGPLLDVLVGRQVFALVVEAGVDLPTGSVPNATPGGAGSVQASLLRGGVGVCASPSAFLLCGRVDGGAMEGTGSLQNVTERTTFYGGFAAVAGAGLPITHGISGLVRAELLVPFTRTALDLDKVAAWTSPSVAATVGLAVGYRY